MAAMRRSRRRGHTLRGDAVDAAKGVEDRGEKSGFVGDLDGVEVVEGFATEGVEEGNAIDVVRSR